MRVRLALVGALAATAVLWPSTARPAATTATTTFEQDVQTCDGHTVHLSGQLLGVFIVAPDAAGGLVLSTHIQPQGVRGTDPQTGVMYIGNGQTRDLTVFAPGGTTTFSFLNRFHIVATKGANGFDLAEQIHITTLADGTTAAFVDHFSVGC